jgi:dipeptidyl aminopeptidase/acylaminoacyl peptidase
MSRIAVWTACGALWICFGVAEAQTPALAVFAAPPRIGDASISVEGRYLAIVTTLNKVQTVVVQDRTASGPAALHAVLAAGDGFEVLWCRWLGESRVLCALHAPVEVRGTLISKTRLVAVDADGKNPKVLMEDEDVAEVSFLSRILAWDVPGKPNTVLVLATIAREQKALGDTRAQHTDRSQPSVYELNSVTGDLSLHLSPREPLISYLADAQGEVVLGWGPTANGATEYDVRDPQSHDWHRVGTLPGTLKPVALCAPALHCAYALGDSDGHTALWRIDLAGKDPPAVEFAHPAADLDTPLIARDGHLFGVRYDTAEPMVYYADATASGLVDNLKRLLPGQFLELVSYTRDGRQLIIKSSSDSDPGSFYLYDMAKNTLARVGVGYPDLAPDRIGHMRPVSFAAQDGTTVPGFLTLPPAGPGQNLPLIALPHGGLSDHDTRAFHLLRAFLVSRGYAVLQINYRGSSGLGAKWQGDSHGDWGGLPYSDVVDGVRWAIQQGVADPKRVCIVGTDYGGYLALLAAERNPDLFRCAVSIGGYSDLALQSAAAMPGPLGPPMGGPGAMPGAPNPDKLRADAPRQHAADSKVPVLLVHGERDAMVTVEQSKAMDVALTGAHRPHQLLLIAGADHLISNEDGRGKMLTALESFLAQSLH